MFIPAKFSYSIIFVLAINYPYVQCACPYLEPMDVTIKPSLQAFYVRAILFEEGQMEAICSTITIVGRHVKYSRDFQQHTFGDFDHENVRGYYHGKWMLYIRCTKPWGHSHINMLIGSREVNVTEERIRTEINYLRETYHFYADGAQFKTIPGVCDVAIPSEWQLVIEPQKSRENIYVGFYLLITLVFRVFNTFWYCNIEKEDQIW